MKEFGEACEPFIKKATIAYGKHRAARMAKRAIHDGCECNALSYLSYSELDVPGKIITRTTNLEGRNAVSITTKCPWYDAWKEEGHLYYFMKGALIKEYGEKGILIMKTAIDEYANRFGLDIVGEIEKMENINFSNISYYQ
jgi:hypothetical protein